MSNYTIYKKDIDYNKDSQAKFYCCKKEGYVDVIIFNFKPGDCITKFKLHKLQSELSKNILMFLLLCIN